MTEEIQVDPNAQPVVPPHIIERVAALSATAPAATPINLAEIIKILITAEPEVLPILQVLFPNNALIAAVARIYPTLLPILQKLELILTPSV